MDWLEKYAYNADIGFLNKYLNTGFDPHVYYDQVENFLDSEGIEHDDDFDKQAWLDNADQKTLEEFKEYISKHSHEMYGADRPATEYFSGAKIEKPGWLVHFTNDPDSIASDGFMYGHPDTIGLGLTTWKSEQARKREPGFNFAFETGTRDADFAASKSKYGKHAVVFWAGGVNAYHSGDEENQIIFWGPSVRKDMIFVIEKRDGEWVAPDATGRERKRGEFNDVVSWVEDNYRLLQNIEKRVGNIYREKKRSQKGGKMHSDELERFDRMIEP